MFKIDTVFHYVSISGPVTTVAVGVPAVGLSKNGLLIPVVGIIVWHLLLSYSDSKHDRNICTKCYVSSLKNIDTAVEKHEKKFRYAHWNMNLIGKILIATRFKNEKLLATSGFYIPAATCLATLLIASIFIHNVIVFSGLFMVALLMLITHYQMFIIHNRYQAVCPICRDDGRGGGYEKTPEPTPQPAATQS